MKTFKQFIDEAEGGLVGRTNRLQLLGASKQQPIKRKVPCAAPKSRASLMSGVRTSQRATGGLRG